MLEQDQEGWGGVYKGALLTELLNYSPQVQTTMQILTWKSEQPTSLAPRHHFNNIKYTKFLTLYASTERQGMTVLKVEK